MRRRYEVLHVRQWFRVDHCGGVIPVADHGNHDTRHTYRRPVVGQGRIIVPVQAVVLRTDQTLLHGEERDRTTLGFIGVEQSIAAGGQFPCQVVAVGDTQVESETTDRRHRVCRVTDEEDVALPECVGHVCR